MKIGVLADTHDNLPRIREAIELFNREKVVRVIHAGDFVSPFALDPFHHLNCEVLAVLGNNDGEREGLTAKFREIGEIHPYLATATIAGRRIATVHYRELAEPLARSGDFDLVVYGHTHEIEQRQEEGLLLNPGEAGGWLTGLATVALVDLETLEVNLREL
ncbi:MAG: metallophosphoesterase [Thermoanaerobaculia bacterium]